MINRYEQQKQMKRAVYDDMQTRVSESAEKEFRREAYPEQVPHIPHIRDMLITKRNLTFLMNRANMLDSWEVETIRRIVARIRGEGLYEEDDKGKTGIIQE